MNRFLFSLLAIFSLLRAAPASWAGPATVACVGDSITAGVGADRAWDYPSQLGRMLGDAYTVRNFGVSGATLLRHGDRPYEKQGAFKAAIAFKPDIVILMLGTNDTKSGNWVPHKAEFDADYRWLVGQLEVRIQRRSSLSAAPAGSPAKGSTASMSLSSIRKSRSSTKSPPIST